MNLSRLRYIIKKEFLRIRRDPAVLRLVLLAPLIQLILFGYGVTNDVRDVSVAICDLDRSPDSRQLITEIDHSHYFRVAALPDDPRLLSTLLLRGTAELALLIPDDFMTRLKTGDGAELGLYVDGSDANTAGLATSYFVRLLQERGLRWQQRLARADGTFGTSVPQLQAQQRVWYNVDLKSVNYMVPGVFGMIVLVVTINLSGLAIVREREAGTLEQLLVTPLRTSELLLGKMIPMGVIGMLESVLVVLFALGWFHVPFRGSFVLLFSMAAVFLVACLGLGLLVSVLSRTQQEAQILVFLVIMPSVLLSGFMFPIANMPPVIGALTYGIPARYFLEIVRGLFLRGVGVSILWPQMLALTFLALALLALGIGLMRKRL
ncbi:MAG: ABC transporter permease [Armatimonadia bacterium]